MGLFGFGKPKGEEIKVKATEVDGSWTKGAFDNFTYYLHYELEDGSPLKLIASKKMWEGAVKGRKGTLTYIGEKVVDFVKE